jgi:hypothetical protein
MAALRLCRDSIELARSRCLTLTSVLRGFQHARRRSFQATDRGCNPCMPCPLPPSCRAPFSLTQATHAHTCGPELVLGIAVRPWKHGRVAPSADAGSIRLRQRLSCLLSASSSLSAPAMLCPACCARRRRRAVAKRRLGERRAERRASSVRWGSVALPPGELCDAAVHEAVWLLARGPPERPAPAAHLLAEARASR